MPAALLLAPPTDAMDTAQHSDVHAHNTIDIVGIGNRAFCAGSTHRFECRIALEEHRRLLLQLNPPSKKQGEGTDVVIERESFTAQHTEHTL